MSGLLQNGAKAFASEEGRKQHGGEYIPVYSIHILKLKYWKFFLLNVDRR